MNLRYPNITGLSEKEQLTQVKGYLYQLVNDLNYALSFVPEGGDGQTASAEVTGSSPYESKAGETQYSDLRALLAQELQDAENLLNQIEEDLANGKLNGPQGEKGDPGTDGIGIEKVEINENGELVITLSNDIAQNLGVVTGENGKDGVDGTSATHSWEGTVLTITSASGTSSADLKGEKGDQGEQGEKGDPGADGVAGQDGKDYVLTEEDKAEIVQAVLDALAVQPNEEE